MMSIQNISETNMLLLGVGNAGGRAAYYVFQRAACQDCGFALWIPIPSR